jgi:hypothetical protein
MSMLNVLHRNHEDDWHTVSKCVCGMSSPLPASIAILTCTWTHCTLCPIFHIPGPSMYHVAYLPKRILPSLENLPKELAQYNKGVACIMIGFGHSFFFMDRPII